MSTLQTITSSERRYIASSEPAVGLVRIPQKNDASARQLSALDNAAFDRGIRTLYRHLASYQSEDGNFIRSIGITSCYPLEGKSTVCDTLASVAAHNSRFCSSMRISPFI
jgi:Mrp family chromosome partitioning ATPase